MCVCVRCVRDMSVHVLHLCECGVYLCGVMCVYVWCNVCVHVLCGVV